MSQEIVLDLKGLKCPLPVLKTRKALSRLVGGDRITVLTTDPMAAIDIPHLCNEDGHKLISSACQGSDGTFIIEKS